MLTTSLDGATKSPMKKVIEVIANENRLRMNSSFALVALDLHIRRISSTKVKTQSYKNIAIERLYHFNE